MFLGKSGRGNGSYRELRLGSRDLPVVEFVIAGISLLSLVTGSSHS
jgi:hypothetical protein